MPFQVSGFLYLMQCLIAGFLLLEGNCPVDQNPEHYKDNKKVNGYFLLFKVC